jgi:hypothetical protein
MKRRDWDGEITVGLFAHSFSRSACVETIFPSIVRG